MNYYTEWTHLFKKLRIKYYVDVNVRSKVNLCFTLVNVTTNKFFILKNVVEYIQN